MHPCRSRPELAIKHGPDHQRAKCGHQYPMGHPPVVLFRISGEETIMDSISNLLQRARDCFTEASFVADLVQQLMARDNDTLLTAKDHSVYRACRGDSISAGVSGILECSYYTVQFRQMHQARY